jgi:hypothetical protein
VTLNLPLTTSHAGSLAYHLDSATPVSGVVAAPAWPFAPAAQTIYAFYMRASLAGDVDMAIVLPLDVVANKLKRLEEELRQLNRKALTFDQERESGDLKDLIEPRLERIRDTIGSIRSSLLDLSTDIEPMRDDISGTPPDQPHAIEGYFTEEDTETRFERKNSNTPRKPKPDRED